MFRRIKKREEEDMLIVHKAPIDKEQAGRKADEAELAGTLEREEIERLKARLAVTDDPAERAAILDSIQSRFGNEVAERIVQAVRRGEGQAPASGVAQGRPEDEEREG
jgi:hypothetical protein